MVKRCRCKRLNSVSPQKSPAGGASEEHECSSLLTDGALAEWVALQELAAQHAERKRVV
jgi:hypothetical protein